MKGNDIFKKEKKTATVFFFFIFFFLFSKRGKPDEKFSIYKKR